jgi:hypothetical protein
MTKSIKRSYVQRSLPVILLLVAALVIGQMALPQSASAATANWDTYTNQKASKDYGKVSPTVVYASAAKDKTYGDSKITYYTDSVSAVLVGQKVKIGFSTDKNQSKASKKVYKVLQKAVKIKSVKWYTKDSKGKIAAISSSKSLKIPKSVKGKKLYVEYQWTVKGVPGTSSSVRYVGSAYISAFNKTGEIYDTNSTYEGVATSGRLQTSISFGQSYYTFVGDTLKVTPTTTYTKRPGEVGKKASKVKYTYQWYTQSYNKKGIAVNTKIKGAKKATYKVPAKAKGKNIYVLVIAKKAGYYTDYSYTSASVSKEVRSAKVEDVNVYNYSPGDKPQVYVYIKGSDTGALYGAKVTVDYLLNGTLWKSVSATINDQYSSSYSEYFNSPTALASGDAGKSLTVKVTVTTTGGSPVSKTSDARTVQ